MKTVTAMTAGGAVVVDLFAGTGGLLVGAVLVLMILIVAVAIFSTRAEPAERLIDLVRGRTPRDPPSTTSTTRRSGHS